MWRHLAYWIYLAYWIDHCQNTSMCNPHCIAYINWAKSVSNNKNILCTEPLYSTQLEVYNKGINSTSIYFICSWKYSYKNYWVKTFHYTYWCHDHSYWNNLKPFLKQSTSFKAFVEQNTTPRRAEVHHIPLKITSEGSPFYLGGPNFAIFAEFSPDFQSFYRPPLAKVTKTTYITS